MFRVNLVAWSQRVRPLRAPVLVVAISALVALLFTIATRPAEDAKPRAAGEANIQRVNDEHALVADFVRGLENAAEAERRVAERERREMRTVALAEPQRDAVAVKPVRAAVQASATPTPASLPKSTPAAAPVIGPPLQLAVSAPSIAPQRQQVSRRPVAERARAVLATVEQIPGWVRVGVENVADWAVSAPSRVISHLPERRFL